MVEADVMEVSNANANCAMAGVARDAIDVDCVKAKVVPSGNVSVRSAAGVNACV